MGPDCVDLRERVVAAYLAVEGTMRELAELFRITENTVQNWMTLLRETGDVEPRPNDGGDSAVIAAAVLAGPDADRELRLQGEAGAPRSGSAIVGCPRRCCRDGAPQRHPRRHLRMAPACRIPCQTRMSIALPSTSYARSRGERGGLVREAWVHATTAVIR